MGRESFRIERVRGGQPDGAIPTAVSETPTGRIFDRRRVMRREPMPPIFVSPRSPRSLLALLITTFTGGMVMAIGIVVLGSHAPAPSKSARLAPPAPNVPAAIVQPAAIVPQAAVVPPPALEPTVVAPATQVVPAPLDEPTPDGPPPAAAPATPNRRSRPERASRPGAARASSNRIVPPTRHWVDPFAG